MFAAVPDRSAPKEELYRDLAASLEELLRGETDALANLANAAGLLNAALPKINWCGFYLKKADELVLGPFQGKPACVRIPLGKGVCGTAAALRETVVVPDVNAFPGHIACDSESNSEIVLPLVKDGELLGVLDLDSPVLGRFDEQDARGLNELAEIFLDYTECG